MVYRWSEFWRQEDSPQPNQKENKQNLPFSQYQPWSSFRTKEEDRLKSYL